LTKDTKPEYNIYIMKWNLLTIFTSKGDEMATVKNYSEKDVSMMISTYQANPTRDTVDMLAEKLGKNARSVIAKLSREGVYVAQPRVTKTGEPVVLKSEFVNRIQTALGIEIPSIAKATKADLQRLADHLEAQ
jgi:hypothetical protein